MIARSNTHVVAIGLAPSRHHPVFIGPGAADVSFFTPLQLQMQPHELYISARRVKAKSHLSERPHLRLRITSMESLTNPSSPHPHEGSNEIVVEVSRSRVAVYKWK
jgi:hypothetical protein